MPYIKGKHLKRRSDRLDSDTPSDGKWYSVPVGGGSPTLVSNTSGYSQARLHSRHVGWDIPNYHRRVREGELLPQTPYRSYVSQGMATGSKALHAVGAPNRFYSANNYVTQNKWILNEATLAAVAPTDGIEYVQEAAAKVYSSGWDALTFVAELTDLRRMFAGAAKTLSSLPLPKNWRKIKLTGEWLSARYGWRTLMYDIFDIHEFIANLNEKRTRFSEKAGTVWSSSNTEVTTDEFGHYYLTHTVQDSWKVKLRGSVTADAWIPKVLINPVATAWELVPFSFVLDWFVSVGQALEAASFLALETAYSSSWGYQVEYTRLYSSTITETKSTFDYGNHDESGESSATLRVRVPCSVSLTPHLTFRMDAFKVFDLLALILQRFRR